jgi:hypothetical protein
MGIVAERILSWERQVWNAAPSGIVGAGIGCIKLGHKPLQIGTAHTAVECVHRCSRQQVAGGSVTVEKSIPPTYALNGGALEYEKLSPRSNCQGSRTMPARLTICVKSLESIGPVF